MPNRFGPILLPPIGVELVAAAALLSEQGLPRFVVLRAQRMQLVAVGQNNDSTVMTLNEIAYSTPQLKSALDRRHGPLGPAHEITFGP